MSAPTFDQVELGDELPETRPDVSPERVRLFCEAARMIHPRFLDPEAARKEGLPGAIVPGIMSQALLAAMLHAWAPGCEVRRLDTVFRAPILVGSAPTCRGAVTDTDDETRCVEIDLTLVDESDQTKVVGTALVSL